MRRPELQSLILLFILIFLLSGCASKTAFDQKRSVHASPPAPAPTPSTFNYQLSPGDQLSIQVYMEEDLTRTIRIAPDGSINYPLIGKLQAANKTPKELQNELAKRLSKYIVNPKVDINIDNLTGFKFFVLGDVNNPGPLSLWCRPTYLEAIAMAGGFTDDADQTKILSLNQRISGAAISAILLKESLSGNQVATTDEIIFVPPSQISNIEKFMLKFRNIISPFLALEQGIIMAPPVRDALTGDYNDNNNSIVINP